MSTTPPPEPAVEVVRVDTRRSWPWVLALGIAALVAGLITIVWPGVTVLALVIVLGVFLLLAGGAEIGWSIAERHTQGWGYILFRGIVDLVTGIVVLAWPDVTALVLALLLAIWLFLYAAIAASARTPAISSPRASPRWSLQSSRSCGRGSRSSWSRS
jgi:uncharacterized membrane protein HdeD (DUF308 family)